MRDWMMKLQGRVGWVGKPSDRRGMIFLGFVSLQSPRAPKLAYCVETLRRLRGWVSCLSPAHGLRLVIGVAALGTTSLCVAQLPTGWKLFVNNEHFTGLGCGALAGDVNNYLQNLAQQNPQLVFRSYDEALGAMKGIPCPRWDRPRLKSTGAPNSADGDFGHFYPYNISPGVIGTVSRFDLPDVPYDEEDVGFHDGNYGRTPGMPIHYGNGKDNKELLVCQDYINYQATLGRTLQLLSRVPAGLYDSSINDGKFLKTSPLPEETWTLRLSAVCPNGFHPRGTNTTWNEPPSGVCRS
jgi:hypothetical protein